MTRRKNIKLVLRPTAKQNNGSAKQKQLNNTSGKQLALQLGGQLGSGLIAGLTPIIVGALGAAVKAAIPGPLSNNGTMTRSLPAASGHTGITGKPISRTLPNGNMVVRHREFVTDLLQDTEGFDLQFQYGINPGNPALFPWLSTVASRFELYRFKHLSVVYEQQTSSTTTGTVMIAVDWDASDQPPTSKIQMMSYKDAVRSVPWADCVYTSKSADLHRQKTNYVLVGAQPPNTDIKTYDVGNLFIANQTADPLLKPIGEIYVDYEVELITPQISSDDIAVSIFPGTNITDLQPLGNLPTLQGSLPVLIGLDGTQQVLQLPVAGYYQLTIFGQGLSITPTLIENSGAAIISQFSSVNVQDPPTATTQSGVMFIQVLDGSKAQFQLIGELQGGGVPPGGYMSVVPFAQGAMPNSSLGPVIDTPNPRARLGRRFVLS